MLSTPQNIRCSQAATYYKRDDYYLSKDGRREWWGKQKEHFGFKDKIVWKDYNQILEHHREREGRVEKYSASTGKDHKVIAGIDLTFCAPKSFSLAMHADKKSYKIISDIHSRAVDECLKYIQDNYVYYRMHGAGERILVQGDNLLVAKVEHLTNRNSEPLIHTHCVLFNQVLNAKNELRAISNELIYKNQILIGQIYQNALAHFAMEAGYKIEITDQQKHYFEIAGYSREQIEMYSTRQQEIIKYMEKEGMEYNAENGAIAAIRTRKKKINLDPKKYAETIQKEFEKRHIPRILPGSPRVVRFNETKQLEFVREGMKEISQKSFAFRRDELLLYSLRQGIGQTAIDSANRTINRLLEMKELKSFKKGNEEFLCTDESYKNEKEIFARATANTGIYKPVGIKNNSRIDSLISQDQRKMVGHICNSKDQTIFVSGIAGSGKSSAAAVASENFIEQGYVVRGMAPTGKAAKELENKNINGASTIHRFLYDINAGKIQRGERELWIVDEASMISNDLMLTLQRQAAEWNARMVLMGDPRQLPPVGAGSAYVNLVQSGEVKVGVLKQNIRQKHTVQHRAAGHMAEGLVSQAIKDLDKYIVEIPERQERITQIAELYTINKNLDAYTVLVTTNADKRAVDEIIREKLRDQGRIGKDNRIIAVKDQTGSERTLKVAQGDRILFLKNSVRLDVKNGTVGTIQNIDFFGRLNIKTGGKSIMVDPNKYPHLAHGYALTSWKAQGATFEGQAYVMVDSHQRLNSQQKAYVDMTRSRRGVLYLVDDKSRLDMVWSRQEQRISHKDFEVLSKTENQKPFEYDEIVDKVKRLIKDGSSEKEIRSMLSEVSAPGEADQLITQAKDQIKEMKAINIIFDGVKQFINDGSTEKDIRSMLSGIATPSQMDQIINLAKNQIKKIEPKQDGPDRGGMDFGPEM